MLRKLAQALGFSPKRRVILHADDDVVVRKIVAQMLDRLGYAALSAVDGAECLRLCDSNAVDLILLDVQMAGIDGAQTLSVLKGREDTRGIPVIMVTATDLLQDVERFLAMGAAGYVTKPLHLEQLQAKIAKALA